MRDIAREVGVSHPVVSMVLSGGNSTTRVSPETRTRILKTARRLGYRKDMLAHAFRKRRSFLVGVLFSGVNYKYASDFAFGVQEVLCEQGCAPVFFTHGDSSQEDVYLERCLDRHVEALIANCAADPGGGTNISKFERLAADGVPVVEVFGRRVHGVPSVNIDYGLAGGMAVDKLLQSGCGDIVHFTHEEYLESETSIAHLYWNAYEFWRGCESAARSGGKDIRVVTHPLTADLRRLGALYQGAKNNVSAVFADGVPDGVVCFSDEEAEALVNYVEVNGITLPDSFKVVSLGGYSFLSARSESMIDVLAEPAERIGREAAAMAMAMIAGEKVSSLSIAPDFMRGME
jgi:LacI family transcriptional regulator